MRYATSTIVPNNTYTIFLLLLLYLSEERLPRKCIVRTRRAITRTEQQKSRRWHHLPATGQEFLCDGFSKIRWYYINQCVVCRTSAANRAVAVSAQAAWFPSTSAFEKSWPCARVPGCSEHMGLVLWTRRSLCPLRLSGNL